MALEDDLRQIRTRISAARTKQARAEVQRDEARAKVAQAKTVLKDEFGVSTNAEIKAKRDELQADLDTATEEIKRALLEAGA
jgi:uncharacterized protein YqfA (UPF0365 family)